MIHTTSTDHAISSHDTALFNIFEELRMFEDGRPWSQGHFAKTLFKQSDFRIVLVSMEKGSKLHEHHADGTISLHVMKGALRLLISGQTRDVTTGIILAIECSVTHDVEALEDSAFLLTMSWPDPETLDRRRKAEQTDRGIHVIGGTPFN
jgi:quercetin dioxygenase-like cupin family protein